MNALQQNSSRLKDFPITFFSTILGLAGFSIAYQRAESLLGVPLHLSSYFLVGTTIVFVIIAFFYIAKLFLHTNEVSAEFNNPVRLSFFPTISISLLLLSIGYLTVNNSFSEYLWWSGSSLHLVFTLRIVSIWIHHNKFEIKHMNPAWFIPAVGNILVPISGVSHFSVGYSWFFFSIGLMFWFILLVIFFNRIIFHTPLVDRLLPTLFILIAPPAIGFVSYVKLTGVVGEFAFILYYFALFLLLLLVAQFLRFYRIKFYLSWWAYSFPVSAITIATFLMYHQFHSSFFMILSSVLFGLLSVLIITLIGRTAWAISKRELCVKEE